MSHEQVGSNQVSFDSIIIFYYYLQMFSHIPFFLLGSQSTSHFPSKVWAKYAVLYMLCQTGSELKPKKSCVLEPAVVNCQILTGETDVTKRKPKFKL